MNKQFNNLKDEEFLKKVEKLIDGKNDRQRFTDSLLGFCSRLIGVKPKPDANFQLSLRRGLLEKYYEKEVESRDNLAPKLISVRRFITMRNIKWFVSAGAVAVIALLIIMGGFKGTAPVSAQEIAQKSYQTVSALAPEQKEALKKEVHMISDPISVLEEAKNAEDLTMLTYDEFVSQNPSMPMPDRQLIDWDNVKFLQFTNPDGMKITLGIDQNNLPVLMVAGFGNPDEAPSTGEAGTSIMNADGTFTVDGKKYTAPAESNGPSSIEVRDDGVYINGVKAIPQE